MNLEEVLKLLNPSLYDCDLSTNGKIMEAVGSAISKLYDDNGDVLVFVANNDATDGINQIIVGNMVKDIDLSWGSSVKMIRSKPEENGFNKWFYIIIVINNDEAKGK